MFASGLVFYASEKSVQACKLYSCENVSFGTTVNRSKELDFFTDSITTGNRKYEKLQMEKISHVLCEWSSV